MTRLRARAPRARLRRRSPLPKLAFWLRALATLPLGVLYLKGAALAFLLRYVFRYRVAVARANLRQSFPDWSAAEVERVLGAHYRQLGQIAMEFIKMAGMQPADLRARIRLLNPQLVAAEAAAGRSVLLLGAHQANWEWSLQAVVLYLNVPIEAAYKPLHSARADRQLRLLRCRFGAQLIMAKRLLREIVRRRQQVRAIAMLADQVPASSDGRFWLTFLGRPTAFYPGPGEIARATGYAAFFVALRRRARGIYESELLPISAANEQIEPGEFMQRYARLVEQEIRSSPADWTWTHRRWKLAPPVAPPPADEAPA